MPRYDFHVVFHFFRFAAIFHGIKGRVIRGKRLLRASAPARRVLPELMHLAWLQAEKAGAP